MSVSFDPKSCSVLANLALSRIRLHKNKRTEQGKILGREVLSLLLADKQDQARIRVVNVIHNDYYLDVLNTLEVFLNVIAASTDVLAAQLSVPLEMKEAVCSICYAAPFLDNSPEMVKIRAMFLSKYRKDEDLLKSTLVHKKVLLGLSHDMPDDSLINYYLSNILDEHSPSEKAPVAANTTKTPPSETPAPAPAATSSTAPHPTLQQDNSTLNIIASQARLHENQIMGTMRIDLTGHHWVLQDNVSQPIYIPVQHVLDSKEGDLVIATLDVRKDSKRSGKIFRNLTVESSSTPVLSRSSPQPLKASRSAQHLGMSALAAEHLIGEASGKLVFDLQQHAWVMDPKYSKPIYIPPIATGTAMPGDMVTVHVFEKGNKLLGRVTSSSSSSSKEPVVVAEKVTKNPAASKKASTVSVNFQMRDNPMLQTLAWKPVPLQERSGLLKREDEHFSMVLDEQLPLEVPVVVLGDAHRNGAENGDRVKVVVFGQTTNPATNSAIILGQVTSILESQPKFPIQSPPATKKSTPSPTLVSPISSAKPPARSIKLVPASAADFVATLELDENGDGCLLHPTLPWTYVIIPKAGLGNSCVGDELAVSVVDGKPKQGKLMGKMVGIVSAVDSYDMHAQLEYESDEEDEKSLHGVDNEEGDVSSLEAALQTLKDFEPEPTSSADAQALSYPMLDRVLPSEVIIIDMGSLSLKVGYANQPVPILSVPTLTGRLLDSLTPQHSAIRSSPIPTNDLVVGKAAHDRRALLQLSHPFQRGLVSDWPAMKSLLLGAITGLNTDLRRITIVMMESESGNLTENRKQLAKILFEDFNLPFIFFARSSTSVLISERRTSGIVVDIGHTSTSITAVYEGKIIEESRVRFPLSGVDITRRLIELLEEDGYRMFQTKAQKITAEDMKIATAFVRTEPSKSTNSRAKTLSASNSSQNAGTKPITYRLTDGTELIISDQAWKCAEILFQPTLIGQDIGGIHEHIAQVIQSSPSAEVADNIFLVGGTSLLPGLRQRLQNELQQLLPQQQVFVDHPSKAQYSAWIGGALVSRLPDFKDCILSKEEYQAEGPSIIETTFE